jgi:hypothetical protein
MQLVGFWFPDHPAARAHGTRFLDNLPLTRTFIARNLHLLEQSRRQLLSLDSRSAPSTLIAGFHMSIRRSRALTRRANSLFLNSKFRLSPVVEISQWDRDPDLHIRALSLPTAMSKMA